MAQPALKTSETIERGLILAGLDALREIGDETLVQVILGQGGIEEFGIPAPASSEEATERVPLSDYLLYRDIALDLLEDGFAVTAFQTGQFLVRNFAGEKQSQIKALVKQFELAASKLPLIGQAAVLAARGNPGVVRASMRGQALIITIADCPECRGLKRDAPFCYLSQGLTTAFADVYLHVAVNTRETKCIAMGDPVCEITVTLEA